MRNTGIGLSPGFAATPCWVGLGGGTVPTCAHRADPVKIAARILPFMANRDLHTACHLIRPYFQLNTALRADEFAGFRKVLLASAAGHAAPIWSASRRCVFTRD